MRSEEHIGTACLLLAIVLFSSIEIAGKIIGHRVDPVLLTFVRFSVTGVLLLLVSMPYGWRRRERLRAKDYAVFALNGFVGIALAITVFHVAILTFEKAASSAVVFSVNPVFVIVFAHFLNREPWTPRHGVAVTLGCAGVCFFAWESASFQRESLAGLALMLVSAALFALSMCIAKRVMVRYGPTRLMGFSALFGSAMLLPVVFVRSGADTLPTLASAWLPVLYIAVLGTAVPYWFYYFGLTHTRVQNGALVFFLKPVLASFGAALVLKETINAQMMAGTMLIVSGLFVAVIYPRLSLHRAGKNIK